MKKNIWKLYMGTFLTELLFLVPIIVPFLGSLGLSMQQILLTEAFFSLTIVILEIPSGYFADRIGRKISVIIGAIFWIIGISFYALSHNFLGISIGAIFWGIGTSFNSGANEALLYETLLELKKEQEYKKIQGNIFFYGRIAAIIGSISGGLLASTSLRLPVYATIFPSIIWLFIAITLKETHHQKEKHETWKHCKIIIQESFIQNKKLGYFLIYTAIGGFFNIDFWLNQRYWEFLKIPLSFFGFIIAGVCFCSAMGSKYAQTIEKTWGEKKFLIMLPIIFIFTWLSYTIFKTYWIVPLVFIVSSFRGISVPVFNDYIQKQVSSDRRATILSIMNFFQKLVFFIFAPFLGWITDIYSIQTAFIMSASLLFIFSSLSLLTLKKVKII